MIDRYGRVASDQLTCGCHVHLEVDSFEEGVGVLDRIGPGCRYYARSRPTTAGFAKASTPATPATASPSGTWPSAGPTRPFGSLADYQQAVAAMLDIGALLDDGMIYFDSPPLQRAVDRRTARGRRVPHRRGRDARRRARPGADDHRGTQASRARSPPSTPPRRPTPTPTPTPVPRARGSQNVCHGPRTRSLLMTRGTREHGCPGVNRAAGCRRARAEDGGSGHGGALPPGGYGSRMPNASW